MSSTGCQECGLDSMKGFGLPGSTQNPIQLLQRLFRRYGENTGDDHAEFKMSTRTRPGPAGATDCGAMEFRADGTQTARGGRRAIAVSATRRVHELRRTRFGDAAQGASSPRATHQR